ncbi:PQQ-dependent sugar dehydrogenase [Mucilaginibacter phyllosphaerae]|uniref:Glucose/arabinose dehydrogenase n=1 Tax=Mucilaginibacter phyllosphaerae TaxID=1812349 RepID=A0A4Y8AFF0_9SPHI|nr:sorbosone dehydrogenase family protein [Mucilaginibacter phyllosphaerae]MBB3968877.1 glucose/arabinose dehydrogenase [Mucilaginibacter phyllosphaerae]TEW67494.1 sorbosone dehydrogenase family protein [Mucilaginibacter phyllosphaerae]GGH13366.1 sorbosone dehydrogenase [Mucilaginibacter phyllosphaerae]
MKTYLAYTLSITLLAASCQQKKADSTKAANVNTDVQQEVKLPAPYQTKSVSNYCKVIGWPAGKTPVAPAGFTVSLFADSLKNPRNIYIAPGGDIFVSEANTEAKGVKKIGAKIIGAAASQNMGKSANQITLLRDTNDDGTPDTRTVFLSQLNQPYGMLILGNYFYVANTDGLWRYDYKPGQTKITTPGKMILSLPAGGYNNHWTRNIKANAAGTKIYVAVGSGTNIAEQGMEVEKRRADVLEINPDGSGERVYASGLRNPAGIALQPGTGVLYAVVNERDKLGDDLVPDYLTSVKEGGFYGWPWAYFGQHEDPRPEVKRPDMVKKTITPDLSLGPHTASLGLEFYTGKKFPVKYHNGAFIGQHGSWNRSVLSGYKVGFVPFTNNKPAPKMEDFLTGFVANLEKKEVYGRPVGVAVAKDGSLLVADDASNRIWRVSAK